MRFTAERNAEAPSAVQAEIRRRASVHDGCAEILSCRAVACAVPQSTIGVSFRSGTAASASPTPIGEFLLDCIATAQRATTSMPPPLERSFSTGPPPLTAPASRLRLRFDFSSMIVSPSASTEPPLVEASS